MDNLLLAKAVDHTILSQTATFNDIKEICDEAMDFQAASACIPPSYVEKAKKYVEDKLKICTVIGFPNGYNTIETKIFETKNAIKNGADEIDMVIDIGVLKEKNFSKMKDDISKIKSVCNDKVLKVIVETCLLSFEEKIMMCKIISEAGGDFIKTSTGFSKHGAKIEDIKLFKNYLDKNVKIKASGGINSLEEAQEFLDAGASRLGSSKIIKIIKNNQK